MESKSPNSLKVYAFNIRSLSKNGGKLLAFLSNLPVFHVLVLTEIGVWNIEVAVSYFSEFAYDYALPEHNSFGGVAIFMNKNIDNITFTKQTLKKTCKCSKCNFESLFVDFEFANIAYTIGGIYRHPNGNVSHFNVDLENVVAVIDKQKTVMILGDINIDIIKQDNESTLSYYTMLLSNNFLPLITLPTRITSHSATCLDHIFIRCCKNGQNTQKTAGIIFCDITDHLATFIFIKHQNKHPKTERPMIRIFSDSNCQVFINQIKETKWEELFITNTDWYYIFINKVRQIFKTSFPFKRLSNKRAKDKPWITKGLKISIKHKNRLYKKSILNPSAAIENRYTNYKKIVEKCLNIAENDYYKNIFDIQNNSAKTIWKNLTPFLSPQKVKKSISVSKILHDGVFLKDNKDITEAFNEYFCSVGNNLSQSFGPQTQVFKKYLRNKVNETFFITPIINFENIEEIKKLKKNKAPGPDEIGNKLLSLSPETFSHPLTMIFNKAIEEGKYPDDLKTGKVIAIYKKGHHYLTENYRFVKLF